MVVPGTGAASQEQAALTELEVSRQLASGEASCLVMERGQERHNEPSPQPTYAPESPSGFPLEQPCHQPFA
jgi:hypothetical protein